MTRPVLASFVALSLATAGGAVLTAQAPQTVTLHDGSGKTVGTAMLKKSGTGVAIDLDLKGRENMPFTCTRWPSARARHSRRPVRT